MVSKQKQKERAERTIVCECCKKIVKHPMCSQKRCGNCSIFLRDLTVERNRYKFKCEKLSEALWKNGLNLKGEPNGNI